MSGPVRVICRPKLGWRLVTGWLALTAVVAAAVNGAGFGGAVLLALLAGWICTQQLELSGTVLSGRRTRFRGPVDLADLQHFEVGRDALRGLYRVITLDAATGRMRLMLMWWGGWQEIVLAIADHHVVADDQGDPSWRIETDGEVDILLYELGWPRDPAPSTLDESG